MLLPLIISEQIMILIKLMIAMLLGALIGLDREAANKPAGLRTHMLVAGAAVLLVSLGELIVGHLTWELGEQTFQADPIRIIEAIITGVSFLGAGTIIRQASEKDVKGLTTAASLLFASVLGITVALSQWVLAIGATLLVLVVLRILPILEKLLERASTTD
jgi:putative Mg2+ transporter-C (MgtC) family protein